MLAHVNTVRLCAFCRRQPVDPTWSPFCSERCKLQDLARWIDGKYRIPAEPVSDSDSEAENDEGPVE
jgi:endogenous inhibitor of DNA gyrase (YacG/DUF329 family)